MLPGGIQTRNPSKRTVADPLLRPLGHWDRPNDYVCFKFGQSIHVLVTYPKSSSTCCHLSVCVSCRSWVATWQYESQYWSHVPEGVFETRAFRSLRHAAVLSKVFSLTQHQSVRYRHRLTLIRAKQVTNFPRTQLLISEYTIRSSL